VSRNVDKQQKLDCSKWIGKSIIHKEITGSTNVDAAQGAPVLTHGTVITAETQTAGRGRRGRTWISHSGENLYFSLLLKPQFAPDKASMLTLVMALAVVKGIEALYAGGEKKVLSKVQTEPVIQIKWPNDIVIHGKKVCGILTEMQVEAGRIGHVVIGVGINVHQQEFMSEGLEHASSLDRELGRCSVVPGIYPDSDKRAADGSDLCQDDFGTTVRDQLLQHILLQFEQYYDAFCETENLQFMKETYCSKLVNLNKEVRVLEAEGAFKGVALGIDEGGQLLVRKEDGSLVSIYAGEVSVRGLYGYV